MDGVMSTCGGVVRLTKMTSLHSGASHIPSWSVSYLDCFISALAGLDVAGVVGARVRVVVLAAEVEHASAA